MKKKEIILARIISTASASALALFVLVVGIGRNYFSNVALKINNNIINGEEANLYNYYYYSGLHVAYRFLFSITVLALVISILAVLFRLKHCQIVCKIAAISSLITGIYLLFARIYETSIGLHRMIDGFYMGKITNQNIVTSQLLPKYPFWTIAFIIIAILLCLLVKVTKFDRIKLYTAKAGCDALDLLLTGIYSTLILDLIRDYVILGMSSLLDDASSLSYYYVREYFIAQHVLLSMPIVVYVVGAMILTVVLRGRISKLLHKLISIGIPVLSSCIIACYYMIHPTRVFGVLTLDNNICDITEYTMTVYLIQIVATVTFLSVFIYYTYMKMELKKVLIIMGANAILGFVLILIGKLIFGLVGLYTGVIIADIISTIFIVLFSNRGNTE